MKRQKQVSKITDVMEWWKCLTKPQQSYVRSWLDKNPPPKEWQGTPVEYAHCEMPVPVSW